MASQEFNDMVQMIREEYPLLSKEEFQDLLIEYRETGDQKIRDKIIYSNIGLVISIINKMPNKIGVEYEDLFNIGVLGLIKAIDRMDLSKETTFSTYATYWIYHKVMRYIQNEGAVSRIPVHIQLAIAKYTKYLTWYYANYHKKPSVEEVMKELNVSENTAIYMIEERYYTTSLNVKIGENGDSEMEDFIPAEENMEEQSINNVLMENVLSTMQKMLKEREYKVLCMRYGVDGYDSHTLEEIGQIMGVTRERIRQIEKKAMTKIQKHYNVKKKLTETK